VPPRKIGGAVYSHPFELWPRSLQADTPGVPLQSTLRLFPKQPPLSRTGFFGENLPRFLADTDGRHLPPLPLPRFPLPARQPRGSLSKPNGNFIVAPTRRNYRVSRKAPSLYEVPGVQVRLPANVGNQ